MSESLNDGLAEAVAHQRAGRLLDALAAYEKLLILYSKVPELWNNLGVVLKDLDRHDQSIAAYRRALDLRPGFYAAASNLGAALAKTDRLDDALAAHETAVMAKPDSGEALNNLGQVLHRLARFSEAEQAFRAAIRLRPEMPIAHTNLASILLLRGDYGEGLREHEWRLSDGREQPYPQPRWDGSPLAGRTILLHSEQGFGDTIQFCRYVPLIAKQGGRIIVACQKSLKNLLSRLEGVTQIITAGETIPPFDCHLSLMSAPFALKTRVETIPSPGGYLTADSQKVAQWRERVNSLGPGRRIGLVWTGNPRPDPLRTIPGELLAPLARCGGVHWISLQTDAARNPPPKGFPLVDWTSDLRDFDDTAALATNLDLVISIETAGAHLGGALGRPTWTLLPFVAGWRWLRDRKDCPWYSSMRLIRQEKHRDWAGVIDRVVREINP